MMRKLLPILGCVLAIATGAISPAAFAQPGSRLDARDVQSAQEILDDGLDALAANQTTLARQLFAHLLAAHPGTAEAGRAALELEAIGADGGAAESASRPRPNPAPRVFVRDDRLVELRKTFLMTVGDRVFFPVNSAEIGGRSRAVLDHQARWLKTRNGLIITVIGRADDGGSSNDEVALSKARAEAARDRLIAGGIDRNRILVDARGAGDPLALCRAPICQAQNRQVETMIGDPKQAFEPSQAAR